MPDYGSGILGPLGARTVSPAAAWTECAVWGFGDSILRQDSPALQATVNLAYDAQGSRTTRGSVDALEQAVGLYGQPAKVLMASGTNDVFDPTQMGPELNRVKALVPDAYVVWVDAFVCRTPYPVATQLADLRNTAWVNAQIEEARVTYGWGLVRWSRFLSQVPSRIAQRLRPDGVHTNTPADAPYPTNSGQAARNAMIAAALA